MDGVQEILAERAIARHDPGPDEGGSFPWQSGGFIIGNRGIDRERDGRDFGRGPQPQVDAEDIALPVPFLQRLDHALADPDRPCPASSRGFSGSVSGSNRKSRSTSDE